MDVRKSAATAGPDNIPAQDLRDCTHKVPEVLTDIFNTSVYQAIVPTCLKTGTIIPVTKISAVLCLINCHPVALTLIIMKCFEQLVMAHLKKIINVTVDPHQ